MKNKRLQTLLLLLTAGLLSLHAQNMYVQETSGTKTSYILDDIQKLSFADGNLTIDKTGDNSQVYALSDLRYINFKEFTVSMEETKTIGAQGFHLYPNPATDMLNIDLKDKVDGTATLSIISMEGQALETLQLDNQKEISIDINHLPAGLYICNYRDEKQTKTIKFIKQ